MTDYVNSNPRRVFHLENLNPILTNPNFVFNYDVILKVMPYIIPSVFVDLLILQAQLYKKLLFSDLFEGKEKVKVFCQFCV